MKLQRNEMIGMLVLRSFEAYGQEEKTTRMKILVDELESRDLDINELKEAFDAHNSSSKFAPCLADIMSYFSEKREKGFAKEIEKKWEYFLKNGFSPYSRLEPWASDVRNLIGSSRCDQAVGKDLPFIRKEFNDIVGRQMDGMPIQGDFRPWFKIGNVWALPPKNSGNASIGELLGVKR